MLSPLTVQKRGEDYELILGERRLRAAKLLEMETVPCRIAEVSGRIGAEMSLMENRMRENLNLFEEAAALDRLLQDFHYTQGELSERLGMSQSALANKLRLLRLGTRERLLVVENELSERHARALLRIREESSRLFALEYIIEKEYNVRQSEIFIDTLLEHPDEFLISLQPKKPQPKPLRRLVVKDVRLFINSVDKAIFHIREAGFSVEAHKEEEDRCIRYSICVPKYGREL